jgi:uncharacterized lipoprotein YddW (UPF0748 family)
MISHPRPHAAWRAVALVALAACSERRSQPTAPDAAVPAGAVHVVASQPDAIMMVRTPSDPAAGVAGEGGTVLQLSMRVENPKDKELPNKNPKHDDWRSTNPAVASVDEAGLVTALDTGRTLIIATHKYAADTTEVEVIPVPVATVVVTPAELTLFRGDTGQLTAVTLDSAGAPLVRRTLTWAAADPAVASVEGAGYDAVVPSHEIGATTVTATVENSLGGGATEPRSGSAAITVLRQPVKRVVIAPEAPTVTVDKTTSLTVTLLDRFGNALGDREVAWSSLDDKLASVAGQGTGYSAVVTTLDPGTARIVAQSEGVADTVPVAIALPEEARALWVNRFEYTASDSTSIRRIFDKAKEANLNVVYFQVRGQGDAYYYSDLEPCAIALCGSLGNGRAVQARDPLTVAVREGHKRGIQVHAWINAFTGWASPNPPSATYCALLKPSTGGAPNHMLIAHPEWAMVSSAGMAMTCANSKDYEYAYVSPGIPAVRQHLARVAADIVTRYAVDGIHLDRIRYPGQFHSSDAPSLAGFRALVDSINAANPDSLPRPRTPTSSTADALWIAYRQNQVNLAVKGVYDAITAVRPNVVLSAAVWPIYNRLKWGWSSSSGVNQYWQDPRAWGNGGYLDVQVPMTYFNVNASYCSYTSNNPDWRCLLDDHVDNFDAVNGRHTYISIGANREFAHYTQQITLGRAKGVKGFAFYSYNEMNSRNRWPTLGNGLFKRPATVPAMGWKGGASAAAAPVVATRRGGGLLSRQLLPSTSSTRRTTGARGFSIFSSPSSGDGPASVWLDEVMTPPIKEFESEPNMPPVVLPTEQ